MQINFFIANYQYSNIQLLDFPIYPFASQETENERKGKMRISTQQKIDKIGKSSNCTLKYC